MSNGAAIPRIPRRRSQGQRRNRIGLIGLVFLVFTILSAFRRSAVFYTDWLWFKSVDLQSVWSGILGTQLLLGLASVLSFFLLLWLNLWVVDRFAPTSISTRQEDELPRQFQRFARPRARLVRTLGAGVLALLGGLGFHTHWKEWLLFRHGGNFGVRDPQFDMDVGFFVFQLPFLLSVVQWLFYALAFSIIVALAAHYLQGAIRPQSPTNRVTSAVKAHISILLGLLALVRAAQYFLQRYQLSYSTRGVVTGANYTDVNFLLPALGLLTLISLLAAVLFIAGARTRSWSWPGVTVALWALVSLIVGTLIPAGVQKFMVEPAESQKEQPYIKRNIDATRKAIGLENVVMNDFKYTDQLDAAALQANQQTVRNVRLWDTDLVKPSYKRLQESRSFFQFNDIDIDRYSIGGQITQMMLSVREVNNPGGLPQDRRSWVNQHLAYTHGYGAVSSPANAVTAQGEPSFTLKDLPPVGEPPITTPQVYFGEKTSPFSVVNTGQGEVDYVTVGGTDQTSKYSGSGGIGMGSYLTKAALAARFSDINLLISSLVNDNSRAMYLTNLRERTAKAAPFLQYDHDPYAVILDGRILWMQDAFTSSNYYPNAQSADTSLVTNEPNALGATPFNYVRNTVKVVTDAYNGDMKFYVMDDKEPIVRAWQKAFPKLFVPGSTMPDNLRAHIRYPEDLFRVQSSMFGQYHLNNANEFYSRSDRWNIAQEPEAAGNQLAAPVPGGPDTPRAAERRIEPYYLLMKLPNEQRESFLMFQPYVPFSFDDSRKELSAFMVAKSDPDRYGEMSAYVMPRDRQVDGPALVEARIQAEPSISQYITLLDRSGSKVYLGNMLIIPIENSLLYMRPLYVEAQQTRVPEFKKAIVVQGSRIAMADTFQQALTQIFGSAPSTLEAQPVGGGAPAPVPATPVPGAPAAPTTAVPQPGPSLPPAQVRSLLDQANTEFGKADEALRKGDLAGYQSSVQRGIDLVRQARGS